MTAPALKSMSSLLAVVFVALTITACANTVSASSFKGEANAVAQRISDFQSDATALNEQKVCQNDLASVVIARLKAAGGQCEAALKTQLGVVDEFELKVQSIAVAGATANARVKSTWSGKSIVSNVRLVKESGTWKIAELR